MSWSRFLKQCRLLWMQTKRLVRFFTNPQVPSAKPVRHLRLMQLEDRRVLNASLSLMAGIDLTGGEDLVVQDGGFEDLGSGADVQTVDLTITNGTWSVDAGFNTDLYDLSGDGKTLKIDHTLIDDGGSVLNAADELLIQGTASASDAVTIDVTGLDFVPSGGIVFQGGEFTGGEEGGEAENDSLTVTGYSLMTADGVADVTVTHTGAESGTVTLAGIGTIEFSEIEPLTLGGTAADLVINLPAGADNDVLLSDDATPDDGVSRIDSPTNGSFETTTFANPTSSLTVNDGSGAKTIRIEGLDAQYSADLTIQADSDDTVSFQSNHTVLSGGSVLVDAGSISATVTISTSAATAGSITLTADGDIMTSTLDASGSDAGGAILLQSTAGSIDTGGFGVFSFADPGVTGSQGGSITLEAAVDVDFADVNSSGDAAGGEITIDAGGVADQAAGTSITGNGSLIKLGDGTLLLSAANDYTGSTASGAGTTVITSSGSTDSNTLLTDGALDVAGEIDGSVTVNGGTVTGSGGHITGTLTVNSGGTLAPGNSPGSITTGDLQLAAGSTSEFEIEDVNAAGATAGVDYDRVNAIGTVTIDPAATLTIDTSGSTDIAAGDEYVIIANDGSDAVTGSFSGLSQGAVVSTDFGGTGLTARISYAGGDGNDVAIVVDGSLDVTSAGVVIIDRVGDSLRIRTGLDEATALSSPSSTNVRLIDSIQSDGILVSGTGGVDDLLIVEMDHFFTGSGDFSGTISYAGGESAGDNDQLRIGDSGAATWNTVVHTFTGAESGTVEIDADSAIGGSGIEHLTISYSELEPVTDLLTATTRTFTFNAGPETITLTDTGGADNQMTIDSDVGGESVTFVNPTGTFNLNAGSGADIVNISGVDAAFRSALTINGNGGTDTVNLGTDLTLGSGTSTGDLLIDAEATVLTNDVLITTNAGGANGNVTWTGTMDDDLAASTRTLTVTAGTGTVTATGATGGVRPLAAFDVTSAGQVDLANVLAGDIDVAGGNIDLNGTTYTASPGSVEFRGPVDLDAAAGAITVTSGSAVGNDILFTSTVDDTGSDNTLTLASGAGNILFTGAVGSTSELNAITINSGHDVTAASSVRTSGDVNQLAGTGTTAFNGGSVGGVLNLTTDTVALASGSLIVTGTASITAADAIVGGTDDGVADLSATVITLSAGVGGIGTSGTRLDLFASTRLDASTTATGADYFIDGIGNLNVGQVDAQAGNVALSASAAIVDARAGEGGGDANVIANEAALRAATGIGSTDDLDTSVTTLAFANTTSGNVNVTDLAGGLTVGAVDGQLTSFNNGGDVTLVASSPITFAVNTSAAGVLTAQALESAAINFDNITVNAGVTVESTGADVVFAAGDRIVVDATATVQALAVDGDVTLDSGFGDTDADGSMTLNGTIAASNTNGVVTLDLNAQQGATQLAAGTITANGLRLLSSDSAGTFDLDASTTNNVAIIAADTQGSIEYRDADTLSVGTLPATAGIASLNANVTICVLAGNLNLLRDIDAGAGTVRLQTDGGSSAVTQDENNSKVVAASLGVITGSGGIALDSANNNVSTFAASTSGALTFVESDGFAFGTVATAGCFAGVTEITVGGDVEFCLTTGDLSITTTINTAGNTVRLQTGGGNISQTASGVITADTLAARATGNIDLDTVTSAVNTFAAASTTSGDIEFADGNGFTAGSVAAGTCVAATIGVTTADGSISLTTSSGDLVAANAITAGGAGDVALSTTVSGDVLVNNVTADGNDVTILSAAGIEEAAAADATADVTATNVRLVALNGIGDTAQLEIDGTNLAATTQTGDITIHDTAGGLTVSTLTTTDGVTITGGAVGDDITVTSATFLTVNAQVVGSGGGDLTLAALGKAITSDLTISADVSTAGGNGDIKLLAGDTIDQAAATLVSASGTGSVLYAAGTDFSGGTTSNGHAAGSVVMQDGAIAGSDDGNLTLVAPGDVRLSLIDADLDADTVTGDAAIFVDYDGAGGGLSDGAGATIDNTFGDTRNISANSLVMSAGSGIGSGLAADALDIDTDISSLAATSSSGDINVSNEGPLTLGGFAGTTVCGLTLPAVSGVTMTDAANDNSGNDDITIRSEGSLTVSSAVVNSDGGDITLAAEGSDADTDLLLNADVTAKDGSGNIRLLAGDTITVAATTTVSATGTGQVQATAGTNFAGDAPVPGNADGDVTMLDGAVIRSEDGAITVTAPDNVELSLINANADADAVSGDVTVTADSDSSGDGNITDNTATQDANIVSGGLATLTGRNIGTAGVDVLKTVATDAVELDVAQVSLTAPEVAAVHHLSGVAVTNVNVGTAFISGTNDLDLSTAAIVATNLALLAPAGTITLPASATATSNLRIEAANVNAAGGTIDLNANRVLFKSGQTESITVTAAQFDGETNGDLTVNSDSAALELTDLDCDLTAIDVGTNVATLNQFAAGVVTQQLPSDVNQNSRILASGLVLSGQGTFQLTNAVNSVTTLAGNNAGAITYVDVSDVTVDTIGAVAGLTSTDNDIFLDVGTTISINQQLNAGAGDVRLQSNGSVSQAASGIITANALGVWQNSAAAGNIRLGSDNAIDEVAATNAFATGMITVQSTRDLTVGSVTAQTTAGAMFAQVDGVVSTHGDITIESDMSLILDHIVHAGSSDVRLQAQGNVTQDADGLITANELGVRQNSATAGNIQLGFNNAIDDVAAANMFGTGSITVHSVRDLRINVISAKTDGGVSFVETSGLMTFGGDVVVSSDGAITSTVTRNIVTTGEAADRDSGSVQLHAATSVALAGTIDTSGFDNTASAFNSDGGNVTITAAAGHIEVDDIITSGGDVAAGTGGNAGTIAFDAGTTIIFNDNPAIADPDDGDLASAGGRDLSTGIRTGSGADLIVPDPVVLAANQPADGETQHINTSGATAGDVTFLGAVNGAAAGSNDLVINSRDTNVESLAAPATGNVTFQMEVGGTTRLGNVTITDANNVTAMDRLRATRLTQLAGSGNTTLNEVDIQTTNVGPASGLAITTDYTINLRGNVSVFDSTVTVDNTAATGEIIAITSVDGNVIIEDGVIVSTDEDPAAGHSSEFTGDAITITADVTDDPGDPAGTTARRAYNAADRDSDADGISDAVDPDLDGDGTPDADAADTDVPVRGLFRAGPNTELRTDGGVAKRFPPLIDPPGLISATTLNETNDQIFYRSEWDVEVGVQGEENLRVDIDWRDPTDDPQVFAATTTNNAVTSSREQTFLVRDEPDGVNPATESIGHVYTNQDIVDFVTAGVTQFEVDFAVSHHESIVVNGTQLDQSPLSGPQAVPSGVISTTDNPNTGTGVVDPNTDVADTVASNVDLNFESGLLEVRIPTEIAFVPPVEPDRPVPAAAPAAVASTVIPILQQFLPTEVQDFPSSSYSTQSEDYFQLRQDSTDPVAGFEHIDPDIGWKLLQPRRLKEWVYTNDLDGSDYELWLITTKVKDGEDITFERPVLKFDVFDNQPFPQAEEIPDQLPELKLKRLQFDEDGNLIEPLPGDNDAADDGSEQQPGDADSSKAAPVAAPETESVSQVDGVSADVVRSATAGLAVAAVLQRSNKRQTDFRHLSAVSRILGRLTR